MDGHTLHLSENKSANVSKFKARVTFDCRQYFPKFLGYLVLKNCAWERYPPPEQIGLIKLYISQYFSVSEKYILEELHWNDGWIKTVLNLKKLK